MFSVAISIGLCAKKLRETIALQGSNRNGNRFDGAPASRPQGGNVSEFVWEIHKGTESGTTDAHGFTRIKKRRSKRFRRIPCSENGLQSFISRFAFLFSVCIRGSKAVSYAPRRERIASAASFARSPRSPTGPTQDGHPFSQGHAEISSRVFASSKSCVRNSGSEKPIPPGYAS